MPWTSRSASSSSYEPACSGALRQATAGQITTSPRSNGAGSSSPKGSRPGPVRSGSLPGCGGPGRSISSSIGNDSTSVGPGRDKKRSFSEAIAASSTNSTLSSAVPATPRSARTLSASRCQRPGSTGRPRCPSATKTWTVMAGGALPRGEAGDAGRVAVVGRDDVTDDPVPHDVGLAEPDEGNPLDPSEDVLEPDEAGAGRASWDVDLGHVAGHDDSRPEADPREEHLHLLVGGVLGLVEDHEARIERPASHVGERGDFDRAPLHEA